MALIISMFGFALSMSISPGSVNFSTLSSAMNYGFKNTIAFVSGATIGFSLLLTAVCFGLAQLFNHYPILLNLITAAGSLLLIWMGWRIFGAAPEPVNIQTTTKAPNFMQGALMQWLNPKAWIAAFAGAAAFSVRQKDSDLILFIIIYFVVCYLSLLGWAILGEKMAVFLNHCHRVKIMNRIMGLALIIIAVDIGLSRF